MPVTLAAELARYELATDPGEFETVIVETFRKLYPGLAVEQLLYRPTSGLRYVKAARAALRCQKLTEEFLIRRLVNVRKRGDSRCRQSNGKRRKN